MVDYTMPNFGLQTLQTIGGLQGIQAQQEQFAQQRADRLAQQQQQEQMTAARQQASELIQSGTPEQIAQFSMQNPELGEELRKNMLFRNQATEANLMSSMREIIANPDDTEAIMMRRIKTIQEQGGDPSTTVKGLQDYRNNPEQFVTGVERTYAMMDPTGYNAYAKTRPEAKTQDLPSGTREFNDLLEKAASGDETTRRAARIKLGLDPRSTGSAALTITELGNAKEVAQTEEQLSAGREVGKLSAQLKLQPKVRSAVDTAARGAAALADKAIEDKSNLSTFDVYNVGMNGVAEALGNTETGPFVGRLPAVTTNQQIAEGTIAAMAPVLKQMFRAAGEGAFTDYDQKLLLDMMPTRKDSPEAAQAKLANIDAIVRSKLNVPADYGSEQPAAPQQPQQPAAQQAAPSNDFSNLWGG